MISYHRSDVLMLRCEFGDDKNDIFIVGIRPIIKNKLIFMLQ